MDIAPAPASRAAFGDTPYFAVRAEPSACASTDLGTPPKEWSAGRQNGIRGYETEPKASMTCRGRTGTG